MGLTLCLRSMAFLCAQQVCNMLDSELIYRAVDYPNSFLLKPYLILFWTARSFFSSSVVSGQKTYLYCRVIMYFSIWSIAFSTFSGGTERYKSHPPYCKSSILWLFWWFNTVWSYYHHISTTNSSQPELIEWIFKKWCIFIPLNVSLDTFKLCHLHTRHMKAPVSLASCALQCNVRLTACSLGWGSTFNFSFKQYWI